jgi:hypothetical protein
LQILSAVAVRQRKAVHRIPLEVHGYRWYRVGAAEQILQIPKA